MSPPVTTDDHAATYAGSATIHLSAIDVYSGIASTTWALDGVPGSGGQVTVGSLGVHSLSFASSDKAGNVEGTRTVTFVVRASRATRLALAGPASVKFKKALKLTGTLSPSTTAGKVTITMTRLVGKKYKSAGTANVTVARGAFSYSFKPKYKGSWHFVATYSGGAVGFTTYQASKSLTKTVKVK